MTLNKLDRLLRIPANPLTKEPAREVSYIMIAGGPPVDGVQVLEIQDHSDLEQVKVTVRHNGKEHTLHLCNEHLAGGVIQRKPVP